MNLKSRRSMAVLVSVAAVSVLGALLFTPPLFQPGYDPISPAPVHAAQLMQVNLNLASAQILQGVPGMGEKKAAAIVGYREANGAFSSLEDLLQVPEISESDLESWKSYLYVQ